MPPPGTPGGRELAVYDRLNCFSEDSAMPLCAVALTRLMPDNTITRYLLPEASGSRL